jgi:hypothetical protein
MLSLNTFLCLFAPPFPSPFPPFPLPDIVANFPVFSENLTGESFFSFFLCLNGDFHREAWPGIYTRQSSSEKAVVLAVEQICVFGGLISTVGWLSSDGCFNEV